MNSKMTDSMASGSFWKKTGMLAATVFLSHMAFTSGAFSPTAFAPVAQAQPDLNNAPKGENPPPRNRPNRPGRGDNNENRRSPEDNVRRMLAQAGVDDAATQTAVLDYIKTDMEARGPLREQGAKIFRALREGAVTDDQLLALVTDYRAAQQAEKARREQAEANLDAKINYSKNPRLEAMLLLSGLIGDGPMMFQGGGRGGPGERGGRGGRGGQGNAGEKGNAGNREERQKKMLERFDTNKDGKLDDAEKAAMQEFMQKRREQRQNGDQPNGDKPNAAPAMQDQDDA
jgi:hypothetical protein